MKWHSGRRLICVGFLAVLVGNLFFGTVAASAASKVPYSDPSSVGSIGLCDQSGQPLTHGDVDTRPFIWKAVDETAAPAPYNTATSTATLYAYQPRPGVDAADWSGAQLNIASKFADPSHPASAMTGLDQSLAVFIADYPPEVNGLIQLRIYLNAPNQPTDNSTYDSANIAVSGNTWSVVGGSSVACSAGQAVSLRQVAATNTAAIASLTAQSTQSATTPTPRAAQGKTSSSSGSNSGGAQASGTGGVVPAPSGSPASGDSALAAGSKTSTLAASGASGKSSHTLLWILVGVGVVGAGFFAVQWVRSRT